MLEPTLCPAGKFCPGAFDFDLTDNDCPKGTFSDLQGLEASTDCQLGAFGYYYTSGGVVSAGAGTPCNEKEYCYPQAGAPVTDAGVACAAGEICPAGTAVAQLCPPGTYSTNTGPSASYDCTACPANYYCPAFGLTGLPLSGIPNDPTDLDKYLAYPCPAGYECLGGAIHESNVDDVTMRLCPRGYKCDF